MDISIVGRKVYVNGDRVIGVALNNLVDRFEATTDMPDGWEYKLDVWMSKQKFFNTIVLYRSGSTIYRDLTKEMIPYGGKYDMQFVAINGDLVSRTEIFEMWVEDAVDQTPVYNPIPNEFLQIQEDVEKNAWEANRSAKNAESYANSALSAKDKIENMDVSAVTLNEDQDATVEKEDDGVLKFIFGIPQGKSGKNGIDGVDGKDGKDGISPIASVVQTDDGAIITITDSEGTTTAGIKNGKDGSPGKPGDPGLSPSASVTQTSSGATITISDVDGTTTAEIKNGKDGTPGMDGASGEPGFSPSAYVTQIDSGATITIIDADGMTTAEITNGQDGIPGKDGISPSVFVQQTDVGANISITDASGTTTAEIKNGKDGEQGPIGPAGSDGKTPEKGIDYWTDDDKAEIVAATVAALPVYGGEVQDFG